MIRHVDMQPYELEQYEKQVTKTIHRYLTRMQWLLGGSRKSFGSIIEDKVNLRDFVTENLV